MNAVENRNPDPLLQDNVFLNTVDESINATRSNSVWPLTFGLACCAIEMMATVAPKYDIDRFGSGPFRGTPRQADLMIVAGTVTHKMAPRVKRLYDQMPEPKYVIAMGGCVIHGGPYVKHGYHVLKGVDLITYLRWLRLKWLIGNLESTSTGQLWTEIANCAPRHLFSRKVK